MEASFVVGVLLATPQERIAYLEKVAKANKDKFKYTMDYLPQRDGTLKYRFTVKEAAEGHVFLEATADDSDEATEKALLDLDGALKQCGYKKP